jgi:hypothetical protein
MGVVVGLRRKMHAFAQTVGELRGEADLHGATVGLLVAQGHENTLPVLHLVLPRFSLFAVPPLSHSDE